MKRTMIALGILTLVGTALAAPPKSKTIEVKVGQVNDRRSSGSFSSLNLTLQLPSVPTKDVAASRVFLKAAVDGSGNNLLPDGGDEPQLAPNPYAEYAKDAATPASVTIELKNPGRDAKTLKEVRGEIELFMPSRDANSMVAIPKFQSQAGKSFAQKGLKANGVEISLISRAQWDAERKKRSEVKREEAKKEGFEGEDLDSQVSYFLDMLFTPDEGDILLKVKDPNKRIQEFSYVEASGEAKRVMSREEEGMVVLSTWGAKPEPDTSLRISMKTEKNLVRYPFVVTDVSLP